MPQYNAEENSQEQDIKNIIDELTVECKKKGADIVEIIITESHSTTVACRKQKIEGIDKSNETSIGLRVVLDQKQAMISSNIISPDKIKDLAQQAIDTANFASKDKFLTFATTEMLGQDFPNLDLYDKNAPDIEEMLEYSYEIEKYAMNDSRITNSEGAEFTYAKSKIYLALDEKFYHHYQSSLFSANVAVIAGEGDKKQTDYYQQNRRFYSDLASAKIIGEKAKERTLRKLNPQKIISQDMSVIFDPRISKSLVNSLLQAINAANIARDSSFLKEYHGVKIFRDEINIIDDPRMPRGLSSRVVDGEGIATIKNALVENGVFTNYLTDLRYASELGIKHTANAIRGLNGGVAPAPSNVYLKSAQNISPDALISDIKYGLYLTDIFGMGVNIVTGHYSQGAGGYLIENGKITHAVDQITIASNLLSIYSEMIAANDLSFEYGVNAPTILVPSMIIAGS